MSSDHEKIVKQLEGIKWPLSKEQFADIEELLYEISTAPNNTFQKFKQLCDDLKGWPTYNLSLDSFTDCLEGLLIWLYNTQKDVTKSLEREIDEHVRAKPTLMLLRRKRVKEEDSIPEARKNRKRTGCKRKKT